MALIYNEHNDHLSNFFLFFKSVIGTQLFIAFYQRIFHSFWEMVVYTVPCQILETMVDLKFSTSQTGCWREKSTNEYLHPFHFSFKSKLDTFFLWMKMWLNSCLQSFRRQSLNNFYNFVTNISRLLRSKSINRKSLFQRDFCEVKKQYFLDD